jgi:hypothetical protein
MAQGRQGRHRPLLHPVALATKCCDLVQYVFQSAPVRWTQLHAVLANTRLSIRSHAGGCEQQYLLVYDAVKSVPSRPKFRKHMLAPSAHVAVYFRAVPCLAHSSALKMEPTCSSETSIDFQRTTQHYIPEDRTHRNGM